MLKHVRLVPSARSLATRATPSSLAADSLLAAPLYGAAAPSGSAGLLADDPVDAVTTAEEAALPPVDWSLTGGEASSAAGRVRSANRSIVFSHSLTC